MKILSILLVILLLSVPGFVFADCNKVGTTVIYINGVFETKDAAKLDKDKLEFFYKNYMASKKLSFSSFLLLQ